MPTISVLPWLDSGKFYVKSINSETCSVFLQNNSKGWTDQLNYKEILFNSQDEAIEELESYTKENGV